MKLILLCVVLALVPAYAADPVFSIQSVAHAVPNTAIHPDLMPGLAGVGQQVGANSLPCLGPCYGLPSGSIALPPAFMSLHPS
jgi:hypothetical protein